MLAERPDRPCTVLAVLTSSSSAVFDNFGDLRQKMVIETALLGGDALILGPERRHSTLIFNTVSWVESVRKELAGEVIVFARSAPG